MKKRKHEKITRYSNSVIYYKFFHAEQAYTKTDKLPAFVKRRICQKVFFLQQLLCIA